MTNTEVEPTVILASRLGEAQDRIAKANKRLAKAGLKDQFKLLVGQPYDHTWTDDHGFKHTVRRVEVALEQPTLGYNGWTFVATLSFEEGGTVVRTVPGQDCSYRPTSKVCDQCHTDRYRNETFVVRNDQTGEYRQVGRNCLDLFFGLKPALWIFSYDPSFDELSEDEEGRGGYGHRDHRVAVLDVVAAALAASNEGRAYRPASFEGSTTKGEVFQILFGHHVPVKSDYDREYNAWLDAMWAKTAENKTNGLAAQVVAHVQTLNGSSEYAENARILANSEYADEKNVGIIASFAKLWANEKQYEAERQAKAKANENKINDFYADVNDKVEVAGTVTKIREIDGDYGTSRLVEILTTEGYTVKTFSTSAWVWGVEEGDEVTIKGTVKKHETYHNYKSTVLTRTKAV